MTKEEIYEIVVSLIQEQYHADNLELSLDTSLRDDLGVDSITLMEFVVSLEDRFGIDIPDEDVDNIDNIALLLTYLEKKLINESIDYNR